MATLYHHGILGQKWGVRRFQNEDGSLTRAGQKRYTSMEDLKTKKGETVTVAKRRSKLTDEESYDIYARGKKVGDLFLENHGDELYVNWIGIKASARGRGYASSLMDYVVKYGEKNDYKYATLEVPTSSPDARHIYEKAGFKETGKASSNDDIWEGLTSMKKDLRKK